MNYTHLSIDQSPGFLTPVRFFISAPLFAVAACIVMLISGPPILQDRWLPAALGATHLMTLGFITMCMLGALFQLLPVLVGASLYKAGASSIVVHAGFSLGVMMLACGLVSENGICLTVALVALIPSLLLFLINVSVALFRKPAGRASADGMRYAVLAFWVALIYGALLASGHALDDIPLLRQHTGTHILWSALGWVTLMIIAVSYQVIPMFQVTREYPDIVKRLLIPSLFLCILAAGLLHHLLDDARILQIFMTLLFNALLLVYVVITLRLLLKRNKKLSDASFYYWLFALCMLCISLMLFTYAENGNPQVYLAAGLCFFLGFVVSVINSMLYKIVPFLVWLHLQQSARQFGASLLSLPTIHDVIPAANTRRQFFLHMISVLLLIFSALSGGSLFYAAILLLLSAFVLLQINLITALRCYRRHRPPSIAFGTNGAP